ncbi:MAG TPA: class I SAM-dependent methyltransferase [Chloroflexia bacterium]|nr:class I SAM-dependent methyltransferase [Chloroflexia bacterium]
MISERLIASLVCTMPECRSVHGCTRLVETDDTGLRCPSCGTHYPRRAGYVDLMLATTEGNVPSEQSHTSLYVSQESEFAETLDYKRIGMPLLGAGVRQRAIRRMLHLTKQDRLVELGCGNGKFVYWNRKQVDWAVGIDPAPLFAVEALETVDLCRADARTLPFEDGAFTAAMSIDVLEHLPLADIEAYLREARRVLEVGGRVFIYSNTREGSRLDFAVRGARLLSAWLGRRGLIDNSRDTLRKSDHVKALATYPELEATLRRCGFRVREVIFWNGLFQSAIENLLVKIAESALRRLNKKAKSPQAEVGEDKVRSRMRGRIARRGVTYRAMRLLTELMWLDLALFGRWRAGPYFLLAEREDAA